MPAFAWFNRFSPQNYPTCNNQEETIENIDIENNNIQDQAQKQVQRQTQDQTQSANNEGNYQTTVFQEAETKREHHTGTPVTFASLGAYKESAKTSSRFQTAKTITMFKDTFSYKGAIKRYWKGACKTFGSGYNGVHKDNPSKEIKVYDLDDKIIPGSVESIGFLTIIAEERENVTSFIVMQRAIILAAERQADAFVVTKEGEETVTKSSGWGIGFNTSGSVINDMDNRGRSAAGSSGTGYSSGKGRLERLPWIKIQLLKFK